MRPYLVHQFLEAQADGAPERSLCVQGDRVTSYGEIDQQANRFAHALLQWGIKRGDRVTLLVENSSAYVAAYFGILKSGAVAVPLYTTATRKTIEYVLGHCEVRVLVTEARLLRALGDSGSSLARLRGILLVDEEFGDQCPTEVRTIADGQDLSDARPAVGLIDVDLASIVYTSGSTGEPRGAMLSHLNLVSNTASIVSYLKLTAEDRVMVVLPFPYVYGKSLLNTHVAVGGSVLLERGLVFPNVVLRAMQKHRATGFAGTPTTYAILLGKAAVREMTFPDLRYLTQAGAAMAPSLIREVMEAFKGKELYIMYGATEAGARLSYLAPEDLPRKIGSIGKAVPNVRLRVLRQGGSEAAPGEVGEIVAQGSNIMRGYWNQRQETAEVLSEDGFHTGDLATVDEQGFLYVVGRKRDIIKSGGNRVSAKEVEETILEFRGVLEVAVIGVPDQLLGERIHAFIVPRPEGSGSPAELQEAIISFCRDQLPEFKVPRRVVVRESLPKNESGKIMKDVLRNEWAAAK